MDIDKLVLTKAEIEDAEDRARDAFEFSSLDPATRLSELPLFQQKQAEAISLATVKKAEPLIRQDERERITKGLEALADREGNVNLNMTIMRKQANILALKATVEKEGRDEDAVY